MAAALPEPVVRGRRLLEVGSRDVKKKREATDLDIVLFEIRYRFIRLLMDLLPKRYRRAVHEGLLP